MNLPMATLQLAFPSSVEHPSPLKKVSPAPPLTPQDIQQIVKNIVDRRESERGRVFFYNDLYAFVGDPHNTLLLLSPSTLEKFIKH